MKTIDIAKDFSKFPAGRILSDGPYSGERFRDELLYPSLSNGDSVKIILDGTRGYGSSFLEEAFGGLVRVHKMNSKDLLNRIEFVSSRPIYINEIIQYIKDSGNVL